MSDFSKEAVAWFDEMRESIRSRIDTFSELPESEKSKYKDVSNYFDWPISDQEKIGYPGAIEYDVDHSWDVLKPKTRKELGGKSNAALLAAQILRDEFNIDIVEKVKQNSQPCYLIQDKINEYDWEEDEENGYKKLVQFINNKDLDKGSALELYWGFSPDYYTQFEKEAEIGNKSNKKSFRLLKKLEKRLLEDNFKTNIIPYKPSLSNISSYENAKWEIPVSLTQPNIA